MVLQINYNSKEKLLGCCQAAMALHLSVDWMVSWNWVGLKWLVTWLKELLTLPHAYTNISNCPFVYFLGVFYTLGPCTLIRLRMGEG